MIVNHQNTENVCINVAASGATGAEKVYMVDEEHDFEEVEADINILNIPANAIVYIEF